MENLTLLKITVEMIEDCVDLFIDTFTKEPWYDVYESRDQVVNFFKNHLGNNYCIGYVAMLEDKLVALSIGIKKPWIKGLEYYIDEYCVRYEMQGKGIGSWFLNAIEEDIKKQGLTGIILNTDTEYPSYEFYIRNGFEPINGTIFLGKGI